MNGALNLAASSRASSSVTSRYLWRSHFVPHKTHGSDVAFLAVRICCLSSGSASKVLRSSIAYAKITTSRRAQCLKSYGSSGPPGIVIKSTLKTSPSTMVCSAKISPSVGSKSGE